MPAVEPAGNETYWVDAGASGGVRLEAATPGVEKFWYEGSSSPDQPPLMNADTGKFFLEFE